MLSVVLTAVRISTQPDSPSVVFEGRRAGLIGWLLNAIGLSRLSLQLDATSVQWVAASIGGEQRVHAPTDQVVDAVAGMRRPVLPLLLALAVAGAGVIGLLATRTLGVILAAGLVCAVLFLIVLFRQRVFLAIRLRSGSTLAMQWKRGLVEGVAVDQVLAQRVAEVIRQALAIANEREAVLTADALAAELEQATVAMRADEDESPSTDAPTGRHESTAPAPPDGKVPNAVHASDDRPRNVAVAATRGGSIAESEPATSAAPTAAETAPVTSQSAAPVPTTPEPITPTPLVPALAPVAPVTPAPAPRALAEPLADRATPGHRADALPPTLEAAPRPRSTRVLLSALLVTVVGAGGAWMAFAPRTLTVRNELYADVFLTLPDGSAARVPARSRTPITLSRRVATLAWAVEPGALRGPGFDEAPNGDSLRISARADSVLLTVRNFAEPVFAPIISNRSAEPIGIVVNPGLRNATGRLEEVDCTCRIEPGTENEFIGYYRAYANSGVRITTPDGRSVTFTDVAGESSSRSGASPLRISPR